MIKCNAIKNLIINQILKGFHEFIIFLSGLIFNQNELISIQLILLLGNSQLLLPFACLF